MIGVAIEAPLNSRDAAPEGMDDLAAAHARVLLARLCPLHMTPFDKWSFCDGAGGDFKVPSDISVERCVKRSQRRAGGERRRRGACSAFMAVHPVDAPRSAGQESRGSGFSRVVCIPECRFLRGTVERRLRYVASPKGRQNRVLLASRRSFAVLSQVVGNKLYMRAPSTSNLLPKTDPFARRGCVRERGGGRRGACGLVRAGWASAYEKELRKVPANGRTRR